MKTQILAGLLTLATLLETSAAVYTINSGTVNLTIPDGNPNGVSSTLNVSVADHQITGLSVTLNVSGGYNGDLYAYLSYGGVLVPLVNRIGVGSGNSFGASGAGMNVTLTDGGALGDIHLGGDSVLSGTYEADGRNISPLSSAAAFDSASRVSFAGYNTLDPNGTWTLFFADVSGGGVSTLNSWSMDISAVPEPVNVAMPVFGGLLGAAALIGHFKRRTLNACRVL